MFEVVYTKLSKLNDVNDVQLRNICDKLPDESFAKCDISTDAKFEHPLNIA